MNTKINIILLTFIVLITFIKNSFCQSPNSPLINTGLLYESMWQYTYTLHVESNTVVHQALDNDKQIIYFKYNGIAATYNNGEISESTWNILSNQLTFTYRDAGVFTVSILNNSILALTYRNPKAKGTYQYHFKRIQDEKDSPFKRSPNDLPLILIEEDSPAKHKWWRKDKPSDNFTPSPTYINIEVTGGGYYGGIDPTYRDYILIKNDGRIIKEYKGQNSGLIVNKKTISRFELEQLAAYMVEKKFFTCNNNYDCNTGICTKRKTLKPYPIPLRIGFTYGSRHKVISIQVWGLDEKGIQYVDYPKELDEIIHSIQTIAHRIENNNGKGAPKKKRSFFNLF
ncbi:MAG: hypothetical protein KA010_00510 [Saprospiraceae bacterium]|nr:hypothetical protein [Saprospiraceae bacterium]